LYIHNVFRFEKTTLVRFAITSMVGMGRNPRILRRPGSAGVADWIAESAAAVMKRERGDENRLAKRERMVIEFFLFISYDLGNRAAARDYCGSFRSAG
jgi:hypothetical protein